MLDVPHGPYPNSGTVAQKIAATGVLIADARCKGALSLVINTDKREIIAAEVSK